MYPNRGEVAPQSGYEAGPAPEVEPDQNEKPAETPATPEKTANRPLQPVISQPVSLPAADEPAQAVDQTALAQSVTDNHSTLAENKDVIEKHWVERAKNVIARTKDDPFAQKNEMSKIKADYIKSRFNKTIKTDTGAA